MQETCEFCGTRHYAHKELVCGDQLEEAQAELEYIDEILTERGEPKPYPETPGRFRPDRVQWIAVSRDTIREQRNEALAEVERQRGRCKNTALAWAHAGEMQAEVERLEGRIGAALERIERYVSIPPTPGYRTGLQEAALNIRVALRGEEK